MSANTRKHKPNLTKEEALKLLDLFQSGKSIEEIAALADRSKSTVRGVINRAASLGVNLPPYIKTPVVHVHKELEEMDLASLPNDVYFEHSKDYII